jgi:MinD superfamily P-loop ATPase
LVCQADAIVEVKRRIGWIDADRDRRFLQGRLDVGEPVGVPIITALKKRIRAEDLAILDCAPGSSCGVVRTLEGCDYALLVAEPTPFGLHDFRMVVALVKKMRIRAGVVLNKSGSEDAPLEDFCREEGLPILLRIPYLRGIAEWYSSGRILADMGEEWTARFRSLARRIEQEVGS